MAGSAAPAVAAPSDVACVGVERPDCTLNPATLTAALAAEPGLIHLGPGPFTGQFESDEPVEIDGSAGTAIRKGEDDPPGPVLALTGATVALRNVRVEGRLVVAGDAALANADLATLELDAADATGRNLTVTGSIVLAGGTLALSSSVVGAADPFTVAGGATVATEQSAHAADADASAADRIAPPADPRAIARTPLVDAGDPAPLAPFEPFEDASGAPRITDGNGDGVLRRDIGAYEVQPDPVPVPASSVLVNGGAEDGLAGWSGGFASEAYGDLFLPSLRTGRALGAGARFFSAAGATAPDLFQRIDVSAAAALIDRGTGSATLSGLLGGYGADLDELEVRAVFKDPEGIPLATLDLPPVTAADRANDTNLLTRSATKPIPARTRAVDVLLRGERRAGSYTDAYADNLGLVLSVPGTPVDPPVDPDDPPVGDLKPFNGVSVLTAQPRFSRRGVARVAVACATATVGSCSGSLELGARLPGAAKVTRIARYAVFSVRPGAARHVAVRLLAASRAKLRRTRTLPATLIAIARDGQGLQRRATIPVTMQLRAGTRRRR